MKLILSALAVLLPVCQAGAFELDSLTWKTLSARFAENADERLPKPSARPEREWTIMLYMNGKSNVEPFVFEDVNELEAVGSTPEIAVVAEVGRAGDASVDEAAGGSWSGARIYYIEKDSDAKVVTSPVLSSIPKLDMGDYKEVVKFTSWAKAKYPARKYALIIWDHGWGWLDPKRGATWKSPLSRSISHDFTTNNYIRTEEMRPMMRGVGKVDFYASMACFMQLAEVAYEMRDYADVVVGSEEVIQLPSFDFTAFLTRLNAKPHSSSEEAGKYLVDTFKDFYSRPDMLDMLAQTKYGTQLSALRINRFGAFMDRLDAWARAAVKLGDDNAIRKAKEGVLRMEVGDEGTDPAKLIAFYADLGNFIELYNRNLADAPASAAVKAKGQSLLSFMDNELVIRNTGFSKDRTGKDYSVAHGISIDIPGQPGTLIEMENKYSDLSFAKDSFWPQFRAYVESVK